MATKKILVFCLFFAVSSIFSCQQEEKVTESSPVDYVDPFIGVLDGYISNSVIGPQLPFGSINPSPQTPKGHHDGYSPDEPIRGFGQLHATGTGWGKYGMLFISPQTGLNYKSDGHDSPKSNEFAKAYEYGVRLDRYGIDVKFTPSHHSAIYEFTYPKSDSSVLIFDVTHNIPMHIETMIGGTVTEAEISISEDGKVQGHGRYAGGFGDGHYKVYFTAESSKTPKSYGVWLNDNLSSGKDHIKLEKKNDHVGAYFHFDTEDNESIALKIAVSFKSIDQAKEWLSKEISEYDYSKVRKAAYDEWDAQLGKIWVQSDQTDELKIFYTALFNSMRMPRDRTGDFPAYSKDEELWDDHFAVWDTWRTVFPLHAILNPGVVASNINSFIHRFKKNGVVKDAFIAGIDMAAEQGGNNVDNIISDAFVKNIEGVDWEKAYQVMKSHADNQRLGAQGFGNFGVSDSSLALYKELGWIPAGIMSTSMTLEYAYNDFCVAQVAKGLGKTEDYEKYSERSTKWINLWDAKAESEGYTGFISTKEKDGDFIKIDIKEDMKSWKNYFYEASSWTYTFFVPHQVNTLIELSGGKEAFVEKLNYGMEKGYVDYENEPAFLATHLFHYAQRPDLASYWVHHLMDNDFTLKGYPGNEDSGAMGSWYVFAAMGFFPNAGQDLYFLHGPKFEEIVIMLENQKQIEITAENLSSENIYVQSCTLDGQALEQSWIRHADIKNGAKLHFVMGKEASEWGSQNQLPSFELKK